MPSKSFALKLFKVSVWVRTRAVDVSPPHFFLSIFSIFLLSMLVFLPHADTVVYRDICECLPFPVDSLRAVIFIGVWWLIAECDFYSAGYNLSIF